MRRTALRNVTNEDGRKNGGGVGEEEKYGRDDGKQVDTSCVEDDKRDDKGRDQLCGTVCAASQGICAGSVPSDAAICGTLTNCGLGADRNGRKVLSEKDENTPKTKTWKDEPVIDRDALTDEERSFLEIMEIDAQKDITMEHLYAEHFFARFKDQQVPVNYNYMVYQQDLTWRMRTILVDWLIDVHWQLSLHPETLFLTVDLVDRFLSVRTVSKNKLQLVGVTALMVAAKYEEVDCPQFSTFRMLINCDASDLINAERYFLMTLDFNLNYLSPLCFVRRLSVVNNYEIKTRILAKYILELMLLSEQFIGYNAHIRATASFYTARKILEMDGFHNLFFMLARLDKKVIKGCVNDILVMLARPVKYDSVKRKYGVERMMRVSVFIEEFRVKHLSKYL